MSCEQTAYAAGAAALAASDPEQAAFRAHAAGCADCAAAFRQAEQLTRLLEAAVLPAPTAAALQRALSPVVAELRAHSPEGRVLAEPRGGALKPRALDALPAEHPRRAASRAKAFREGAWLRAGAALLAFAVPVLFARGRDLAGAGAALLVVAAATLLAATAGALRAGALIAVGASAGFALAAGGVPGLVGAGASVQPFRWSGSECFALELLSAAAPLLAAAWVFRRAPRPGALLQAAAAGALAGQAALHLTCGASHDAAHLWVFHVGAVLAAALVGFLVEGRLQPAATSARS